CLCLTLQSWTPPKIAFVEMHGPCGSCFYRRRLFTDVVSVQQIRHFQAQQVSGAQPRWFEPFSGSLSQQGFPQIRSVAGPHIEFIAKLAAIARSGREASDASDLGVAAMMHFQLADLLGSGGDKNVA